MSFSAKDSEADRRRKQAEYDRELAELTELRRKREPELLRRFDDIIERVRRSRNELLDPKLELHIPIAKSDLLASGMIILGCLFFFKAENIYFGRIF